MVDLMVCFTHKSIQNQSIQISLYHFIHTLNHSMNFRLISHSSALPNHRPTWSFSPLFNFLSTTIFICNLISISIVVITLGFFGSPNLVESTNLCAQYIKTQENPWIFATKINRQWTKSVGSTSCSWQKDDVSVNLSQSSQSNRFV